MWLSLPHLVHLRLQLYCNSTGQNWTQLARRTQLSYIIVRRPLDLWNQMFNRHQAEITVMQFRGHSLPVHPSVVGPLPCPILSALICPRDLFRLLTIGMCHFLPVHHLGIAFLGRVEGQNITGRLIPWAGRVVCKEKTYFQDTLDHVVTHSYHTWLIWHRLGLA